MAFPPEIDTALKLVEIASILGGGGALFYRTGRMTMKFEQIGAQQAEEISELKLAVKELVAQTGRFDRIEERQLAEGKRLDSLSQTVRDVMVGNFERRGA